MRSGRVSCSLRGSVVACCLAVANISAAVSMGVGPSTIHFYPFHDDSSVRVGWFAFGSTDLDFLGARLPLGSTTNPVPDDVFLSLDLLAQVRERDLLLSDVGCGTPCVNFRLPLYFQVTDPNSDSVPEVDFYVKGMWPAPQGGGINVGVGGLIKIGWTFLDPTIPPTVWSLENTSPYDITDGVLLLERNRYIRGLTIPAGGSITVQAQLAAGSSWSFGGILDSPERSPVIAFNKAGLSPEGKDFLDVFGGISEYWYPSSGLGSAMLADMTLASGEDPEAQLADYVVSYDGVNYRVNPPYIGRGKPVDGYQTYFAPSGQSPVYFDLYAFSTGQKVGQGMAAGVPEPATLLVLAAGLMGMRLARRRSRA